MKRVYVNLAMGGLILAIALGLRNSVAEPSSAAQTSPLSARWMVKSLTSLLSERTLPVKVWATGHYWDAYPNTSESYGVNFEETEGRGFLNRSQKLLNKAVKSEEDRLNLAELMDDEGNFQAIRDHYQDLPENVYFVEEATRVKMINFLIASLEIDDAHNSSILDTVNDILEVKINRLRSEGIAKSIAGDQIRLLAALHKYRRDSYIRISNYLTENSINVKILKFYENSIAQNLANRERKAL